MYAYRNAEVRSQNYVAVEINKYYIFLCARASVGEGMRIRACIRVCLCVWVRGRGRVHVALLNQYATRRRHIVCRLSGSTSFIDI